MQQTSQLYRINVGPQEFRRLVDHKVVVCKVGDQRVELVLPIGLSWTFMIQAIIDAVPKTQ